MEGVAGAAGRPSIGQPLQPPSSGRMMLRVSPAVGSGKMKRDPVAT